MRRRPDTGTLCLPLGSVLSPAICRRENLRSEFIKAVNGLHKVGRLSTVTVPSTTVTNSHLREK